MNKIKEIKLDKTNWLEVTIVNDLDETIHCESFGDSDEYITLLKQRCDEFCVELSEDNLSILLEQKSKRKVFTTEEIAEIKKQTSILNINTQIQETKNYLSSTDFCMTVDKYASLTTERQAELTTKRAESRELINTLEAGLLMLQVGTA